MSEIELKIGVQYSCRKCGLADIEVQVPARGTEDVIAWMNNTLLPGLVRDHHSRSPRCHPDTLSTVKIPMTGTDRVGGASAQ
jgi:hypothetical protein